MAASRLRRAVLYHILFLKDAGRGIPIHEACTWKNGTWRGPEAPPRPDELADHGAPSGAVEQHTLTSRHLGEERRLTLYLPPDGMRPAWVLFFLDGFQYGRVLDNLQARRAIPPLAALGIAYHPQRRLAEYQGVASRNFDGAPRNWHRRHEAFLTEEVVPWAEGLVVPALASRPRRIFGGVSAGAFGALHFALSHPGLVDAVLCQSMAGPEEVLPALVADWPAGGVPLPRVYFTAGVLEPDILREQRIVAAALAERGAAVRAEEPVRATTRCTGRSRYPTGSGGAWGETRRLGDAARDTAGGQGVVHYQPRHIGRRTPGPAPVAGDGQPVPRQHRRPTRRIRGAFS